MARKATEVEERLSVGEKILTEEFLGDALPKVRVKAVYLGGNTHKTVRLKGQITILREARIAISDIVTKLFGERKWVQLLPEEQEQVRNVLADHQKDVLEEDVVMKQEAEHFTTYDFSTVDALGRKIPYRTEAQREKFTMTPDGHRFQWVEHLGHIVQLNRALDQDGAKQFEIRGNDPEIRVIREYIKLSRRAINPDSGAPVLKDMGLTDDDG